MAERKIAAIAVLGALTFAALGVAVGLAFRLHNSGSAASPPSTLATVPAWTEPTTSTTVPSPLTEADVANAAPASYSNLLGTHSIFCFDATVTNPYSIVIPATSLNFAPVDPDGQIGYVAEDPPSGGSIQILGTTWLEMLAPGGHASTRLCFETDGKHGRWTLVYTTKNPAGRNQQWTFQL
jgi:hypothetical protein